MNTVRGISLLIVVAAFFSCHSEKKKHLTNGKYYIENDTCKTIQILDESNIIVTRTCEQHSSNESFLSQKLDGEIVELFCYNELKYQIDSIDVNDGQYISVFDKNGNRCYGFHIIDKASFWVVTPLKEGDRIDFHFTVPTVYRKINTEDKPIFQESLTIQLSEEPKEELFYIAYNQKEYSNSTKDNKGNISVELKGASNYFKTDLEINPSFYAFEKYQLKVLDTSKNEFINVPIVYHADYNRYLKMSDFDKEAFRKREKIDDRFVVIYRFNPGRKRVVDKIYQEKINGQVQTFEFVKV